VLGVPAPVAPLGGVVAGVAGGSAAAGLVVAGAPAVAGVIVAGVPVAAGLVVAGVRATTGPGLVGAPEVARVVVANVEILKAVGGLVVVGRAGGRTAVRLVFAGVEVVDVKLPRELLWLPPPVTNAPLARPTTNATPVSPTTSHVESLRIIDPFHGW
jgi:hypothetical protein